MLIVFFILHRVVPESVPFGIREVISGLIGCAVAAGNFFMMAVTVQKIAELGAKADTKVNPDDPEAPVEVDPAANEDARRMMKLSYRNRMLLQLIWAVLALALPAFNGAAGIIPLFIPSLLIKARGIAGK